MQKDQPGKHYMADREDAFIKLLRENDTRLRKICRVYERDNEAQEDLYQDILLQLWRALPSFNGEAQPGTWLYRVALNTALSRKRADAARRTEQHEALDESHSVWRDNSLGPDETLDAQQQLERLYEAIDRLGDLDKALVMLFLDEKNYRDIAQILGISESNVGVKLHRIKKELASWLTEDAS
jgi:RNA polymerase sigma-70 factor, ECF subfamily